MATLKTWPTRNEIASAGPVRPSASTVTPRNTRRHIATRRALDVTQRASGHCSSARVSAGMGRGSNPQSSELRAGPRRRRNVLSESGRRHGRSELEVSLNYQGSSGLALRTRSCAGNPSRVDAINTCRVSPGHFALFRVLSRLQFRRFHRTARFLGWVRFPAAPQHKCRSKA
jgi:hypothetical protein